ncbi:MAG: tetratricopeptide repeat protein [Candidatus Hodarchaeota archaeon]
MDITKHKDLILTEKLADKGDFEEALQLLNSLEKKNDLNDNDQLSYFLLKSLLLFNLTFINECFKFAEKAYEKSRELGLDLYSVDALILKGKALTRLQRLDDALDIFLHSENLLKNITQILHNDLIKREASIEVGKSFIFFYKGDGDKALKQLEKSLKLREELGNKKEIIETLSYIGNVITFYKGNLELSLEFAERCKTLIEEVNTKSVRFPLALNLINLGNIQFQKGAFDHALNYYSDSIPILEELNDNEFLAAALSNISNIYFEQGEFERSLEIFKKTYTIQEKVGNPWYIGINFLNLINNLVILGDISQAKSYLEKFEKFNSQIVNDFADKCYRFCSALILKTSTRTHNRAKSEELLKNFIEEDIVFKTDALIQICDLYLTELRITNDLEILDDIQPYIDQLLDIAEKKQSYNILCETYLLQARIALLVFDIKKTRRLLIQAHQIAKRHNLRRLAQIILSEHEELIKQLDTWKRLKKMKAPISERIELSQLNNQIKRIVQKSLSISTQISEETVTVHKDKKICLVCKGEVLGFSYICKCDAIYCENCARALSDIENVCWMCNTPIDRSKPIKSFQLDEEKEKLKNKGKK